MKKIFMEMVLTGLCISVCAANDQPEPDQVIRLWDGDAPGLVSPVHNSETLDGQRFSFKCVSVPELWVYLPDTPAQNRQAIMICPGGGFGHLDMGKHVRNVVRLFNDQGIVVIGLKYRTNYGGNNYVSDSLVDSERGMRLIRYHAAEWGIDPNRICAQGYSAGGTVCMNLLGHFDDGDAGSPDPVERLSSRPDYVALMCPWPNGRAASAYPMLTNPPPVFIASAEDDKTAPTAFAQEIGAALTSQGGTVKWFIVPTGGHGAFHYGVSPRPGVEWPTALKAVFP
jgi:acetyl esterase/lipase